MAILVTCEACKQTFRVRDEYLDKKAWCPACRAPITLSGERVPNHEVFISYSNKDKQVADAICAKLEALPLRCWIAPRDVAAGHSWGSSIIEAIEEAKVMVLVYSGNSNLSPQVIREVERAVSKGLVLVPFRIEATMMSKDMEYFLSSSHWIDALTPPLEKHLVELGELVRTVLFRKEKEAAAAPKPVQPMKPVPTAPASPTSQSKSRTKLWLAAAVALVAVLGMAGWWFGSKAHQTTNQKTVVATSSVATEQPSLVMTTPKPVETPVAMTASAPSMGGAAITISCSEEVHILPLETGQLRMFNSNNPVIVRDEKIGDVNPELSGWQFTSIPKKGIRDFFYELCVNQGGYLYAFGFKQKTAAVFPDAKEEDKWETAEGSIRGQNICYCLRRKVTAGEIIKLRGNHLQLAARSIELLSGGKTESNTQPTAPTPTPAAVAPVSAPQPGQPWINSLGMKFVPVPGTAVMFSIWDTRVQDYQAFVTATGRAWPKPDFEQGPTHPAVMVNWQDAKAFCAWLTEKERRAGTLNASQEYRLPTDLEWSAAVGLPKETGNTPRERNHSIKGVYAWGTQWPPPRGAGNYSSRLNVDDFANTSPVGSFAANRFGLYDMGGNVWQWCEDFLEGQSGAHVLRGGGFDQGALGGMFSSFRNSYDSDTDKHKFRIKAFGFRCVLAKVGTGAANPASSSDK